MSEPKDLIRAKEHLEPGETVVEWSSGLCESTMLGKETKRRGVVIATPRRVFIFVAKSFDGFEVEEFPMSNMSSIEYGKGMLGHTVKFIASGNAVRITMMNEGNPKGLVEYVRGRLGKKEMSKAVCPSCGVPTGAEYPFCTNCGKPMNAPKPADQDDLLTKLERLADLHGKGMLDADEFQKAKAKLLG